MRYELSNKDPSRRPLCPSCAQVMRLVRITSRFEDLPDLYTFECRACGLSHIETARTRRGERLSSPAARVCPLAG
jgi:hypothetical protein